MRETNIYVKISFLILIGLMISEILIYSPILNKSPVIEVIDNNANIIEFRAASNAYPLELQIVVLSAKESQPARSIYIYYDSRYQIALVDLKQARGLVDHLIPELKIREYNADIKTINASGLSDLLLDTYSANQSILVITTGTFPDIVYAQNMNLVKPWIEAGGTLFWVGDRLGYYSAKKTRGYADWTDPSNPKSEKYILGEEFITINKMYETAKEKTQYTNALNLKYPYVSRGTSIAKINAKGGKVLGFTRGDSTSIASIPLGKGKVVIFGGGMTGLEEVMVAKDIAQIIASRALDSKLITYKNYSLGRNKEQVDSIVIRDSIKNERIIVYAYQLGDETTFFKYFELEPKQ